MTTATTSAATPRATKTASLVAVAAAYVAAAAVAALWLVAGPDTGQHWADALIADLLATVVIFGFSRAWRNSSCYDPYWSVAPPLLVGYWWAIGPLGGGDVRAWLIMAVILVWAVRLTANWAYGWPGLHHEDWRYPMLREKSGSFALVVDFAAVHLFPTLQVFLACLPAFVALTRPSHGFDALDVLATLVGLAAVALETVADLQLHRFVRLRRPGQVMDVGVWAWSRHPNYFGEFGFWVAIALFGVAARPGEAWWLWVGAAAMLAMFLGASIPMMEDRSLARRPDYQAVIDRVSRFVPRPPRRPRDQAA
ncbi:MAG: DUF1295 domain-containing protein [Jatrophihabitans sp.]|uniref:DUF1295 domain-containing protein n=1 Tax=Jatrophihabitans sp. TaxID=1932789 RepID=UPI003F8154A0